MARTVSLKERDSNSLPINVKYTRLQSNIESISVKVIFKVGVRLIGVILQGIDSCSAGTCQSDRLREVSVL